VVKYAFSSRLQTAQKPIMSQSPNATSAG